ncbi:MAG: argininosuccinate lyase [Christensenellaceae bacterium]|nr:argininosuccinate lyase [Christensenellaceae bacterium]
MKLWGGRFKKETSGLMEDFHSSIGFDCRMYREDITGSIAHAQMLGKQGIIPQEDAEKIVRGLKEILIDIEAGKIEFSAQAEDIHMNIENLLTQRIGEAGKRLHTGRSRNDQVALDIRMYQRRRIKRLIELLKALEEVILKIARAHLETIMPGYTHLQKAQPITLAHHAMAYFQMFARDIERLKDCYKRTNICPLGSGALAGTTYPLDREYTARLLDFPEITQNSLDGVSDRDFLIECAACCSIIMMHLSRWCEELILWSSNEFGFVEMDDAFSTGSSIMPQKKNPDACELIRGKTGRVYGDLNALLSIMKSLPLAYNKDMQEDKEAIFDAVDTVEGCLEVFTRMLETVTFNIQKMHLGAGMGFTNATDAADYLVKKGLPFREAHEIIGRMVLLCLDKKCSISQLSMQELKALSPVFEKDFYDAVSLQICVEQRLTPGGPSKNAVAQQIAWAENFLKQC